MRATILILSVFESVFDYAVLRPRDIIESTGLKANTVRTTLKRLVAKGALFHVGHGYYSRRSDASPPRKVERIKALEERVEVLEKLIKHYQNMGKL